MIGVRRSVACLTTFRNPRTYSGDYRGRYGVATDPPPGCVIISQYITRHTGRFPPAVGVGVPDDPFLHPPPTPPRSANPLVGAGFHPRPAFVHHRRYGVAGAAGGLSRPQRGNPRRGFPLYPLLRFISTRRVPRAAARVQGLRPWTPPAFL